MKRNFFFLSLFVFSFLFANNNCSTHEIYCNALYLQPNSSNLYYGAEALPLPIPTPNWKSLEIKPDFHFGFDIGVKTLINRRNTKLQLSWERLHSSDSSSRRVSEENMVGPYFNIGPDAEPYKIANGHVTHEFDAVNFNLGNQLVCFNGLKANWFGGISITRIKQDVTSDFSNYDGTITRHVKAPTIFLGGGPEFGLDFIYRLCGNFSLISDTSCALLLGTLKNHTTYKSNTPLLAGLGISPPNKQKTDVPRRTQIVPAFCGKLGLSYATCYCESIITVNVGYQVQAYFNAIQSVDMSSEVTTPPEDAQVGVYALGFRRTISNFLLAGPFVSLKIMF